MALDTGILKTFGILGISLIVVILTLILRVMYQMRVKKIYTTLKKDYPSVYERLANKKRWGRFGGFVKHRMIQRDILFSPNIFPKELQSLIKPIRIIFPIALTLAILLATVLIGLTLGIIYTVVIVIFYLFIMYKFLFSK